MGETLCHPQPRHHGTTTHQKAPVTHPEESYKLYKQSVEFWIELTEIPTNNRVRQMNWEDVVKNLLEYLDKIYTKDIFVEYYNKYKEKLMPIANFILDFKYLFEEVEKWSDVSRCN